ncbi:MAG: ion channel [Thermonemataceae bacterium]|nr:ion channel [Thermonemataceae bacterium]
MYRFEILLVALLLVLFDKIFFADAQFFTKYIWSANMIFLGLASIGIFKEQNFWLKWFRNILLLLTVLVPIFFGLIAQNKLLLELALAVYALYYSLILAEVLRQITKKSETDLSVIFGSISGFLLLIVIALFAFLILEYNVPKSFNGITGKTIPELYNQLSYFAMVTLTTVGYGDITPATDSARLTVMFFTIVGQFYMVALVGIIISRFTSSKNE